MAYCLTLLIEVLEQMLHPEEHHKNWVLPPDYIFQVKSLFEKAVFLKNTLSKYEPALRSRMESLLESRIRVASEKAEDILESHIAGLIRSSPDSQSFTICCPDLHEVIEEFESAKENIMEIMNGIGKPDMEDDAAVCENILVRNKSAAPVVVGVTQDLNELRERLLGQSGKLEIIPIVGRGGTGKTTLARVLYDEFASDISRFRICAWAKLSGKHNLRGFLLSLLRCIIGKCGNEIREENTEQLAVTLYESLCHRKYLIVLDDIWGIEVWDAIQKAFPDNNVGSRIIFTSREHELADSVGLKSHQMQPLDKDDSWELLRNNVHSDEPFPREWEEVGKAIAANCRGLPLAIQLISGVLTVPGVKQNKDFWGQIAASVNSLTATQDEQFSRIFSLSYANLPHSVRPCLLYMASYDQIDARRLMMLWAAEGFLNPVGDRTHKDVAEMYMKILADRNLICVTRTSRSSGEAKAYIIQDLLRDLCVRKAEEENFLYVEPVESYNLPIDTFSYRRARFHVFDNTDSGLEKLTPLTRSFLYTADHGARDVLAYMRPGLSLLRVLDLWEEKFYEFPTEILQLINLRYLALLCECELPESISKLNNLQMLRWLDIKDGSIAVIFDLPQLRHFVYHYPDPAYFILSNIPLLTDRSFAVQENLQSISYIPLSILVHIVGKVPGMRILRIKQDNSLHSCDQVDLTCFSKLEKLCCYNMPYKTMSLFNKFPDSIKKISLYGCGVPETVMNAIGMLANLQMFKVEWCFADGKVWELPDQGQFCSLQYLHISDPYIVYWSATESSFPQLRHLVMEYCEDIEYDLPDIGGIQTLEMIEVKIVSGEVKEWARKILEEQRSLGKTRLQVRVNGELYEPEKV